MSHTQNKSLILCVLPPHCSRRFLARMLLNQSLLLERSTLCLMPGSRPGHIISAEFPLLTVHSSGGAVLNVLFMCLSVHSVLPHCCPAIKEHADLQRKRCRPQPRLTEQKCRNSQIFSLAYTVSTDSHHTSDRQHTHTHAHKPTCTHTHMHTHPHAQTPTRPHTHSLKIHTRTHTNSSKIHTQKHKQFSTLEYMCICQM